MSGMTRAYARNSRSQKAVGARVVLPLVAREAKKRGGARVVEVGCGPGNLLVALRRLCSSDLVGLDRDGLGVALARKAGFEARRVDFRRVPAGLRGKFGVVFSNEALHWTELPPARFRRASWFYRFLPLSARAACDAWGEKHFVEGLRGTASLLAPGGAAVLQFGGHGQIQELFSAFDLALAAPRFARYRGKLWYPTFYPKRTALKRLLVRAGLKGARVKTWSEPLSERTVGETVAFVRAFTERMFLKKMRAADREVFYERLAVRLRETGLRGVRWQRTLVVARGK